MLRYTRNSILCHEFQQRGVMDTGYGLRGISDLPFCKVESTKWLKTQTEPQKEANSLNKLKADMGFLFLLDRSRDIWNLLHGFLVMPQISLAESQPIP